jgi:hypothetical protein
MVVAAIIFNYFPPSLSPQNIFHLMYNRKYMEGQPFMHNLFLPDLKKTLTIRAPVLRVL